MTDNTFRPGFRGYAAQRAATANFRQQSAKPAVVEPSHGGRPVRGVAAQRTLEPTGMSMAMLDAAKAVGQPIQDVVTVPDDWMDVRTFVAPVTEDEAGNVELSGPWVETTPEPVADPKPPRGTLKPCPNCGVEYRRLDRHLVRCKAE